MSNAGKKTKYNKSFIEKAYLLAIKGYNDKMIAETLGISQASFYKYRNEHVEFAESLKRGKAPTDNLVENTLLKRALGYEYEEKTTELKIVNGEPIPVVVKTIKKHIPPDVTAQIFWLKNRMPLDWRDRKEIDANMNANLSLADLLKP